MIKTSTYWCELFLKRNLLNMKRTHGRILETVIVSLYCAYYTKNSKRKTAGKF